MPSSRESSRPGSNSCLLHLLLCQAAPGKHSTALGLSCFSRVRFFTTPCTVACQASLSVGFSRQEGWGSCHVLLQGIFLIQGSNPHLLCLLYWQVDSLQVTHRGSPFYSSFYTNFSVSQWPPQYFLFPSSTTQYKHIMSHICYFELVSNHVF